MPATTASPLKSAFRRAAQIALAVPVLLVLVPLVVLVLGGYFFYGFVLQALIWVCWSRAHARVLLVYSDSPVWREYLEREVMPRLPQGTVILNWSHRLRWRRWSLSALAFRYFGGRRDFNPLAVVFRPFRWAKVFRFYQPFRDFKHGKGGRLNETVHNLFQQIQ